MKIFEEILSIKELKEELTKCIKYKTINKEYLSNFQIVSEFCYRLNDITFQYEVLVYLIKNSKEGYQELISLMSELFFQTASSSLEEIKYLEEISKEQPLDILEPYKELINKDKEEIKKYIKNIEKHLENNPQTKGLILRKISWFEEDEYRKIELLKEALLTCNDLFERKLIYYELLQMLIFEGFIEDFEMIFDKAKGEYPDEEMFYEIEGHAGMFYMENEEYEKSIPYLKNVYEWLIYKTLDKPEDISFLNGNFIVFLTVLSKLYYENSEIEKSKKVYEFTFYLLENFLQKIYENEPKEIRDILKDNIYSFLIEYANFLYETENKSPEIVFENLKYKLLDRNMEPELKKSISEFSYS